MEWQVSHFLKNNLLDYQTKTQFNWKNFWTEIDCCYVMFVELLMFWIYKLMFWILCLCWKWKGAREAVAKRYNSKASPLTAEDVIICSGGSGALEISMGALANVGDNFLIPGNLL